MATYLIGFGAALPDRVVTNDELAPLLKVKADWIEVNSGIRERRWAAPEQSASDMAVAAVRDALADAGAPADAVDYIIGGTISPDYQVPGIAPLVQHKLSGCRAIPALDIRAACASVLYSLQLAHALISAGAVKTVVCFGAEAQSKGLDISPESAELSMLFGDGAGALIASNEPSRQPGSLSLRIEDILIASDGAFASELTVRSPGTANGKHWLDNEQINTGLHRGTMNGRVVIMQAVRKLADSASEITTRNNLTMDQIDLVVPHQANANLLKGLGKRLSLPDERIVVNVDRYGNTGAASAFLALWQARREGRLRPGSLVLIMAFAAGFTWGAILCKVIDA